MSVNGGNQTVPTLVFSDGTALTNPSVGEVRASSPAEPAVPAHRRRTHLRRLWRRA